jgi:hypothetical protein
MSQNRRSGLIHISSIINRGFIAKNPLYILVKNWKKITGETIFKVTYPLKLKNGTIVVGVKNHSWLQELNMSKQLMLDNIKKFTTEITDVQFILDTKKRPS